MTLHRIMAHMIAETHRHAGHADIVRELIDGAAGASRRTTAWRPATSPGGRATAAGWSRSRPGGQSLSLPPVVSSVTVTFVSR